MLSRVPKALKVGFRAGFNSFVATLKPTRRLQTKIFYMTPKPKKRDLIVGDIWYESGYGASHWGAVRGWIWTGKSFDPLPPQIYQSKVD